MIGQIVAEAARAYGDAPALVAQDGRTITYAELHTSSDEVAMGLAARGVGEGDVVALTIPSTPEYIVSYLAAAKLGAIVGGVNPRLSAHQREQALQVLGPHTVIDSLELPRAPGAPPQLAPDQERPVIIVLTSGTTGGPKGAVFRERQLQAIADVEIGMRAAEPGSPMLASTEFAHIGVMARLPWHLKIGNRIHMLAKWRARDALRIVAENKIPALGGIAAQIALMLREPSFDGFDLSHVKLIIAGGAPSPPALIREARARFGAAYSVRYSCTESGGLGTLTQPDDPDDIALTTVGRPRPGVEVRIDAEPGEVGEVLLRSPSVMSEYWRNPDATARALRDGWLHTGDLGSIDGSGALRLAGRADDMYIRGGYNVYPQAVEAVLAAHPAVAHVAVVPRADEVMGQIGVAVVVAREAAPSLDDLRAFAADKLAKHELPEALVVVDELPLNAMHKLDRRALEEML